MINIEKAMQIAGWMAEDELTFLAETAQKSKVILEVGCYRGRSTRALADNTDGYVTCVDPWDGVYLKEDGKPHEINTLCFDAFYSNLEDHIRSYKVRPESVHYEHFFPAKKFDFIFIDGDHRYKTVVHDINKSLKYLLPGGTLAFHDYNQGEWPGVKQAITEKFGDKGNVIRTLWYLEVK